MGMWLLVAVVIDGAIVVTGLNYARWLFSFRLALQLRLILARLHSGVLVPVTTSSERMMIYGKENCVLVWLLKGIDC